MTIFNFAKIREEAIKAMNIPENFKLALEQIKVAHDDGKAETLIKFDSAAKASLVKELLDKEGKYSVEQQNDALLVKW